MQLVLSELLALVGVQQINFHDYNEKLNLAKRHTLSLFAVMKRLSLSGKCAYVDFKYLTGTGAGCHGSPKLQIGLLGTHSAWA